MGPQRRGTTYTIWRKYFDFVCSCPLWDPLVTLQMSPTTASSSHIRRSISRPSLFAACFMRCCSTYKVVVISGTFTASFTNLTVSDLTPCNRSHTSNPFSRKHCVEIGTELCVEMWLCTSLLKNRGNVVLMLQMWLQTILKHYRDGKRGEPKYLCVIDENW